MAECCESCERKRLAALGYNEFEIEIMIAAWRRKQLEEPLNEAQLRA